MQLTVIAYHCEEAVRRGDRRECLWCNLLVQFFQILKGRECRERSVCRSAYTVGAGLDPPFPKGLASQGRCVKSRRRRIV